jgi:hypothetical protein
MGVGAGAEGGPLPRPRTRSISGARNQCQTCGGVGRGRQRAGVWAAIPGRSAPRARLAVEEQLHRRFEPWSPPWKRCRRLLPRRGHGGPPDTRQRSVRQPFPAIHAERPSCSCTHRRPIIRQIAESGRRARLRLPPRVFGGPGGSSRSRLARDSASQSAEWPRVADMSPIRGRNGPGRHDRPFEGGSVATFVPSLPTGKHTSHVLSLTATCHAQ